MAPALYGSASLDGEALPLARGGPNQRNTSRTAIPLLLLLVVPAAVLIASSGGNWAALTAARSGTTELRKHEPPPPVGCDEPDFTRRSMKTAFESSMAAMFLHTRGAVKHEMSDVILLNKKFYAVDDDSWNLFEVDETLPRFSDLNQIIPLETPPPDAGGSSYEAIFHDKGTLYVVRESLEMRDSKGSSTTEFHASVVEVQLQPDSSRSGYGGSDASSSNSDVNGSGDSAHSDGGASVGASRRAAYSVIRECPVEFVFEGDSKGFEGAIHLHDADGNLYMLALCEGNHCSEGAKGREKGNGMLVVTEQRIKDDGSCTWATIRQMSIPASADFRDYSGINIDLDTGRVIISSQEESQMWIGQMQLTEDGYFDPEKSELKGGILLDFPRNDACEVVYCNIEGVTWVTHHAIVAVSDQMKSDGRQPARCLAKDQSIHVFTLPEDWESDLEATLAK